MPYFLTQCNDFDQRFEAFQQIPVDCSISAPQNWQPPRLQRTLREPIEVSGPSTYNKGKTSTLRLAPANNDWTFQRDDLPEQLPIPVAAGSIRCSARNIILGSGCLQNQIRMTEHIIAHRLGLYLDNLCIHMDSDDPPLFDDGSLPLTEAIQKAGICEIEEKEAVYFTVQEPVVMPGPYGSFLLLEPPTNGSRLLSLDVAIDFPTIIGKERIQFDLTPDTFMHGARARTNCSAFEYFLLKTVGFLSAEHRHMGYTDKNILVAGKNAYRTTPALMQNGKCLEAVWHRACLDLLAALSLLPTGRLAGKITSYKAGHTLDCRFMQLLLKKNLLSVC